MGLDRFLQFLVVDLCCAAIRKGDLPLVLVQRSHHTAVHFVMHVELICPGKFTVHEHIAPITHTVFRRVCFGRHSGIGEAIGVAAVIISSHGQDSHAVFHFISSQVY